MYTESDKRADRAFLVGASYGKGVERTRILALIEQAKRLDFNYKELVERIND